MAKTTPRQRKTTGRVMHEFKHGELKSGPGGKGGKVKKRKQAIAIALNEAGASKYDTKAEKKKSAAKPKRKKASTRTTRARKVARKTSARKTSARKTTARKASASKRTARKTRNGTGIGSLLRSLLPK